MEVRLPALAENIGSGVVVNILVSEGDRVEKDQDLIELETEKALAAIPAPEAGTVTKILVKEGDEVEVGQVIMTISEGAGEKPQKKAEQKADDQGEPQKAAAESAHQAKAEPQKPKAPEPVAEDFEEDGGQPVSDDLSKAGIGPPASPTIRKLALQLGIDLNRVRGTERGGRIAIEDVRAYIERLQRVAFDRAPERIVEKPQAQLPDFARWGYIKKEPLTQLRKKIAETMTESWTTIPHVTQFAEADITTLMQLLKKHAPQYEKRGAHLTLTSLVIKALVPVLKQYPLFNSTADYDAGEIIMKDYYHFGIAVDTEQGLIVPVLRDVDKKDLLQISRELDELAEKTRQRKVTLDDLRGGTFTISNQGGIGGAHFTPIIHAPEVAILGLGRGAMKAAVINGKIEPRTLLPLALSYDHRLIDGADAARFIRSLTESLESFSESELKLSGNGESKVAAKEQKQKSKSTGSKGK